MVAGEPHSGIRNCPDTTFFRDNIPQQVDTFHQQPAPPFQKVDGEEVDAALHPCATVVRHPAKLQDRAAAIGTWKTNLALIGGLLRAAAHSL